MYLSEYLFYLFGGTRWSHNYIVVMCWWWFSHVLAIIAQTIGDSLTRPKSVHGNWPLWSPMVSRGLAWHPRRTIYMYIYIYIAPSFHIRHWDQNYLPPRLRDWRDKGVPFLSVFFLFLCMDTMDTLGLVLSGTWRGSPNSQPWPRHVSSFGVIF